MTLTELSIKRPTLVVVIFSVLTVLGLFSYFQLRYELLPKLAPPVVTVNTFYPGASPSEVEESVTKVIEDAVSGLDKVVTVHAFSSEGMSMVVVEFTQAVNPDDAVQEAQRKINETVHRLPDDSKRPTVSKLAFDDIPVLRLGVTSNKPSKEFYQFIKDHIQPRIAKTTGVGQIVLLGGDEREIKVNIDSQKLRAFGLSLIQVTQIIKSSSLEFPTGNIKDKDGQFVVKIAGKIGSIEDLRKLVIARTRGGGEIKLGDIAEVVDGQKEYTTINRINGKPAIGINVYKQGDANTVDVSRLVREELAAMEKDYGRFSVKFDVAQDGSRFTLDSAQAVKKDLMLAIILVALVMLVFLHSIRNSLIVMISIPTSLVSIFIGMYLFNFSLNLMTLLAMSLVIGILVDDSIVVLENIYKHLEKGKDQRTAALVGRNEIGFAALSITLVDVVVFLPLSLVTGTIGNILRSFAMVIVISTLLSLFVCFTITPLLASRFTRYEELTKGTLLGRFGLWFEALFDRITEKYLKVLVWSLRNRGKVALAVLTMLVASLSLVPLGFIGSEFVPQPDRGELSVVVQLPSSSTLQNTNYVTQQVEKIISGIPEVQKVFTIVGSATDGAIGVTNSYVSELNVVLVPLKERERSSETIGQVIKEQVRNIPGVKVYINPISILGSANMTPIQISVSGTSLADVRLAANKIKDILETIPGTADVRLSSDDNKPEIQVDIDRQKMAAYGLTIAEVGATLRTALHGDDSTKLRDGTTDYNIRVLLDEKDRNRTADLENLIFTNLRGEQIELKQFARIMSTTGPSNLERRDRNNALIVKSQAIGRPSGTIAEEFEEKIAKIKLPAGIKFGYVGELEEKGKSFHTLGMAGLAAFLFVYLIMVALYDSYFYPFIVLFSLPVALVGALLALALTMNSINIFTLLAMIMLMGLVAKNAILLVDRTNQMKRELGLGTTEALLEAGQSRLRPIVMTTVSMVCGMIPMALTSGAGAEWKEGLAWALIGGLSSSMFFTLVLIPVVYLTVERWLEAISAFVRKAFGMKAGSAPPVAAENVGKETT